MKKVSTAATKLSWDFLQSNLTIGLDLGDRSSCYCVLDESGRMVMEQKVSTTAKALEAAFGACRAAASRWRLGCIRRGSVGC
ncbi:MAG TPA: hypothetical protein VM715_16230 [Candidatus Acidoferrum sp.]|jgi:transposase|nr:hypothetical protein [Candidatus Acidoferrum sp.]